MAATLNYTDFMEEMYKDYWYHAGGLISQSITHLNNNVSTFPVHKGESGTFLEIRCVQDRIVSICGLVHSGIDPRDFIKNPMLYFIPHFFSIRCKDADGKDLSPATAVEITKYDNENLPQFSTTELYGDLSLTAGERFKRKEERFYFPNGFILYSREKLGFKVHERDIDVVKTELLMKADIWIKGII